MEQLEGMGFQKGSHMWASTRHQQYQRNTEKLQQVPVLGGNVPDHKNRIQSQST